MSKDDPIEVMIGEIDEQIEAVNKKMQKYDALKEKRDRLTAARRALTGGNKLTGGSGGDTRLRQADVVQAMEVGDGYLVDTLASKLNASPEQVRGHLNRGLGERFLKLDKLWYLRDPEHGIKDNATLMQYLTDNEEAEVE